MSPKWAFWPILETFLIMSLQIYKCDIIDVCTQQPAAGGRSSRSEISRNLLLSFWKVELVLVMSHMFCEAITMSPCRQ